MGMCFYLSSQPLLKLCRAYLGPSSPAGTRFQRRLGDGYCRQAVAGTVATMLPHSCHTAAAHTIQNTAILISTHQYNLVHMNTYIQVVGLTRIRKIALAPPPPNGQPIDTMGTNACNAPLAVAALSRRCRGAVAALTRSLATNQTNQPKGTAKLDISDGLATASVAKLSR